MLSMFNNTEAMRMITWKEINNRCEEVDENFRQYVETIRGAASELLERYKLSLGLEEACWRDLDGTEHPYVQTWGGAEDLRYPVNVANLDVDIHAGASFEISTVLKNGPGINKSEIVKIKIWLNEGKIGIRVDNDYTFEPVNSAEKFDAVCEEIKGVILMRLNNIRFGVDPRRRAQTLPR